MASKKTKKKKKFKLELPKNVLHSFSIKNSRIRIEYREILRISQYSVRMRENTDQKSSEYGHFSHCDRIMAVIFSCEKIRL